MDSTHDAQVIESTPNTSEHDVLAISPMKQNIIDQCERIEDVLKEPTKFKAFYNELLNGIIESMNNQVKAYVKNSKQSINVDIYDAVLEKIDWKDLRAKLEIAVKNIGKNKQVAAESYNTFTSKYVQLGSIKGYTIQLYDIDPVMNMYSNFSEDSVKMYSKYMKIALNNLNDLKDEISEFEDKLCRYRDVGVGIMLQNIDVLYNVHLAYIKEIVLNRTPATEVVINGKRLQLVRSQEQFIKTSLRTLVCT